MSRQMNPLQTISMPGMEKIKYYLALVLFHLGDWISRPMTMLDIGWLYTVYSKLMLWSYDLDTEKRIWKDVDQ